MKLRKNKARVAAGVSRALNLRLDAPMADRLDEVMKVSRRSKTSIVEESLERWLPELEKRHAAMTEAA